MRGKKAKALRRIAQFKTIGWPDKEYMIQARGRGYDTGKINMDGSPIIEYRPDSIRLVNGCTRFVYQKLKKAL